MVLQASNKIEYDAWMQAVMDAIMGALDHVTPAGEIDATANMKNSKRHLKARERQIETLSSAPGNLCCCECFEFHGNLGGLAGPPKSCPSRGNFRGPRSSRTANPLST